MFPDNVHDAALVLVMLSPLIVFCVVLYGMLLFYTCDSPLARFKAWRVKRARRRQALQLVRF